MRGRRYQWLACLLLAAMVCSNAAVVYAEEEAERIVSEMPDREAEENEADAGGSEEKNEDKNEDKNEADAGDTEGGSGEENTEEKNTEDIENKEDTEETENKAETENTEDGTGENETEAGETENGSKEPETGNEDEAKEPEGDNNIIDETEGETPENGNETEADETEGGGTEESRPAGEAETQSPTASGGNTLAEVLPTVGLEGERPMTEETIEIGSLEDLKKIGAEYPLDGEYELICDIYGGTIKAIGTPEEPFSGIFYGNGYVIAGLHINGRSSGLFGGLSGEVYDLTLADLTVTGDHSGILAGTADGAVISNVLVTGTVKGEDCGAIAGSACDTDFDGAVYYTGTNLPAVGGGDGEGAWMLRSQPPYIAIVMGQTAELMADSQIGNFTFSHYEGTEGFTLDETGNDSTTLTPEETGKFTLTVVYTCSAGDEEIELRVKIPVIISVDDAGLEELSALDGVFYERLGDYEVVQISALEPLQLLEGVFAETILLEQQTAVTSDVPINKITSWEDFKNIGNTDYDPDYTMYAVYLLDCDIESDGEPFTPIGTEENPFYGEFDGRVYSINVAANPEIDTEAEYCGLFGVVLPPETATDSNAGEIGGSDDEEK